MKYIVSILCVALFSFAAFSQQEYDIDEVEVVSMQIPVAVEESGRSVTILDAEEIAALPFTSVDELLRYLPGVNVKSRGGFGVQTDLGMRGSTFSQVLVLIDGVRFSEPLTSHLNFSLPLPINEIDQIEVIRGPASAMYGADAVGGLIHIKTKSFANPKEGLSSAGNLYFGENNLLDGDVALAYHTGKIGLSAGYKKTDSDGETFANPNFLAGISEEENFTTDFDIKNYTLAANYQPTDHWTFNARYAKDDRDFNAKYFYTASAYDESRETTGNELAQFSASYKKGKSSTTLSGSYRNGSDYFLFNPLFSANDHQTDRFQGILQHQLTTEKDVDLGFGLQLETQEIESTDRGNHDQDQMEAFFTALFPVNDFNIMLSQRMGMNSDYGINYTPQASVSYNKDKFLVRSSAGWAVRGPDFTERYVSDLIPSLSPGRNLGNPDLLAEESFSVDLGGSYLPKENLKFSGSVFYRTSNDLVDFVETNAADIPASNVRPDANYLYATNVSEAETLGLELEGTWTIKFSDESSLRLSGDYTNLNTDIDDGVESKYIANHPIHLVNLGAVFSYDKFNASLTNQYVDRKAESIESIRGEIQDDYFLSNIKLGYEIVPGAFVQVRGTNLFDTDYQEILGAQMPGRWFSAGLQWNVNRK